MPSSRSWAVTPERGVFPRNTRHPHARQPYFIDDGDRACAVAHLMMSSGHEIAARDIASRQNNAYVHGIQSDAVGPWLATHGITLEEAALIQPTYCQCTGDEVPVCGDNGVSYRNECVAEACAGVNVSRCGPCNEDDDVVGSGFGEDLTLDDYCAQNDCMCPDSGGGCSVNAAPSRGDTRFGLLALFGLLVAGGLASRRRRRP